jgi:hypothetical protein
MGKAGKANDGINCVLYHGATGTCSIKLFFALAHTMNGEFYDAVTFQRLAGNELIFSHSSA